MPQASVWFFLAATITSTALLPAAEPPIATAQFAYVANSTSNTISGYRLDPASGNLSALPAFPLPSGKGGPASLAVDQVDGFLYVANSSKLDNNVAGFRIHAATGALSPVPGSPFGGFSTPGALATDPLGRFLFIANQASPSIAVWRIHHETGTLQPVPGSPFPAAVSQSLTADPEGRFLYSADAAGTVSAFTIDRAAGSLTPVPGSPFSGSASNAHGIAIDPLRRFLYTTSDQSVFAWSINPQTGALTLVTGGSNSLSGSIGAVTVSANAHQVYTASGAVEGFGINLTSSCSPCTGAGSTTPLINSPFGSGAGSIAADYTGTFVYATSGPSYANGYVSAFRVSPDNGTLTPFSGTPVAAGPGAASIVLTRPRTLPLFRAQLLPLPAGGPYSQFTAKALNAAGEATGQAVLSEPEEYLAETFLFDGSATTSTPAPAGNASLGEALNDNGDIVGFFNSPTSPVRQAFLLSHGSNMVLDTRAGGQSVAYGINNAGHVAGSMSTGTCVNPFSGSCALGSTHAFLDLGSRLWGIGTLGGDFSEARAINNHDQLTGGSNTVAGGPYHAFLYSQGAYQDLGMFQGGTTEGTALNDAGEVTGTSLLPSGLFLGFTNTNGRFHSIPVLDTGDSTLPAAINQRGEVVGTSSVPSGGSTHGFLYADGLTVDLNSLVSSATPLLINAVGINDQGQILANAVDGSVYLLTRVYSASRSLP